jgi:hypothetical protein
MPPKRKPAAAAKRPCPPAAAADSPAAHRQKKAAATPLAEETTTLEVPGFRQDSLAPLYDMPELQGDREVVLAAVEKNGWSGCLYLKNLAHVTENNHNFDSPPPALCIATLRMCWPQNKNIF